MMLHNEKIQEVVTEIRAYQIPIDGEKPLELFADGLCENPGAMHIGLFARQGDACLFTRHMFVGHGTCNEAEYLAVEAGLAILQALYPQPGVPVCVSSDSQLVVNQVNGLWKAGKMQAHYIFLRKFRKTYPFILQKIPRNENQMADSLAQKYILKNSGRCMTLENGRFNVVKQVPATVRNVNTFKAVTNRQFHEYLQTNNLHAEMQHLFELASSGRREAAMSTMQTIRQRAETVLKEAPRTNDLIGQWLDNTLGLIHQSLDLLTEALQSGAGLVEIEYIIKELSRADTGESEIYSEQVGQLRERHFTEADVVADEDGILL